MAVGPKRGAKKRLRLEEVAAAMRAKNWKPSRKPLVYCRCGECERCRAREYHPGSITGESPRPKVLTCQCGNCQTCQHRAYVRAWRKHDELDKQALAWLKANPWPEPASNIGSSLSDPNITIDLDWIMRYTRG
jgi:hypothetical protein